MLRSYVLEARPFGREGIEHVGVVLKNQNVVSHVKEMTPELAQAIVYMIEPSPPATRAAPRIPKLRHTGPLQHSPKLSGQSRRHGLLLFAATKRQP